MTFRQHNKSSETLWRRRQREELLRNGMPDSIIDSERTWNYVLLHGDDQYGSGWNPSHISREQAAKLLALLRDQYPESVGLDLIGALEKRALQK